MTNSTDQTSELRNVMYTCLNMDNPKSFFLFAGAGSGKTRALVEAMDIFRQKYGKEFYRSARKVAVITYTNAACDEIKHRIDYDPIFVVSTIHSFAWELIKLYHNEIRLWLRNNLEMEIKDLQEKQRRGRAGTKATAERIVQIETKQKRLDRLDTIRYFTYNPNGENIGKNSLNHTEVISITSYFILEKPLMQEILTRKYPVLLIDESQDTQKDLVDAFLAVQNVHSQKFSLAFFGDTMQRIYSDGKIDLSEVVPDEWEKPQITINYRCPKRIIRLINKIREGVDNHLQEPRKDAPEGFVRLFLVQDNNSVSKKSIEEDITKIMAKITSDDQWYGKDQEIKVLTLEHHMAAKRGGFNDFFEPLYQISGFKTGVLDGTLSGIPFFSQQILPLVKALQEGNRFAIAQIIKKYSSLITVDKLKSSKSPFDEILTVNDATKSLFALWDKNTDPLLIDILKLVAASGLFDIPDILKPIILRQDIPENGMTNGKLEFNDNNPEIDAWDKALSAPFSQLKSYVQYISDKSIFGTHQGIKGLQFPRVMVILDDNEARGFMFSFDKLLGVKIPSSSDLKNVEEGKETSIDRTRRLFYVTCSRAQNSLAIVVYTKERDKIIKHVQNLKWFDDDEIIKIN